MSVETAKPDGGGARLGSGKRITIMVCVVALLLAVPFVAMQFTSEVNWTLTDFVSAGVILGTVCVGLELGMRRSASLIYRAAVALVMAAAFLMVWIAVAVGIFPETAIPGDQMYLGVLAVGLVGAVIARGRPVGMARTTLAMAAALAVITVAGLALGAGGFSPRAMAQVLGLNGGFAAMCLASAWLFAKAGRG